MSILDDKKYLMHYIIIVNKGIIGKIIVKITLIRLWSFKTFIILGRKKKQLKGQNNY